jgi:hypothetical protein
VAGAGELGQFLLGHRRADLDAARGGVREECAAQEAGPVLAAAVAVGGEEGRGLVAEGEGRLGAGVAGVDDGQFQAGPGLAVGDADPLEVGPRVHQELAGEARVPEGAGLGGTLVAGHPGRVVAGARQAVHVADAGEHRP